MPAALRRSPHSRAEILWVSLRLGCTCFGGPAAHLGYFHREYVQRRAWLSEAGYADLVTLCQFLPGPASSQLGFAIGLLRGGLAGGLLAWVGFTLPSAVLMTLAGYGFSTLGNVGHAGWFRGLQLAAVAVVAQAVWTMATRLCPDRHRALVAVAAALAATALTGHVWVQVLVLGIGGIYGRTFLRGGKDGHVAAPEVALDVPGLGRRGAAVALTLFAGLLLGLPALRAATGNATLAVFDGFYRAGALVFGGGHVVLPLLEAETVVPGWINGERFIAGYGLAQAVPGPLFTFAAYLGSALGAPHPGGWRDALLCLGAIFLPGGLLVVGTLPFWESLRRVPQAQAALRGANAAVVGLLAAALYRPLWSSAVHTPRDFAVVAVAGALLFSRRCPAAIVVGIAAAVGEWLLR